MSGSPVSSFAFSAGGTFAYIPLTGQALQTVALASRDGKLQRLDLPAQTYSYPRVSPDGQQLAIQTDDGIEAFISIYDLKGAGPARRLTFGGRNSFPLWTPDGRRITFQSNREGDRGIFWQLADGRGQPNVSRSRTRSSPSCGLRHGALTGRRWPFQ